MRKIMVAVTIVGERERQTDGQRDSNRLYNFETPNELAIKQ